jgi:hypothetical protein
MPGCACLLALGGLAVPRVALALMWLFDLLDDRLSMAFDSFVLGFLGFLLLPYTTLFYALAYAPIGGVSGFGWFLVILGFLMDLSSYTGGEYSRRQRAVEA